MKKFFALSFIFFLCSVSAISQQKLLIPMEVSGQTDHLNAYGIAYRHLLNGKELDWLLNYRGGSFMFDYSQSLEDECKSKGVSYENISGTKAAQIYAEVQNENNNMEVVRLEKVAKIAVYVPPNTLPWDDAVQLALDYTGIPYDKLWDEEVLQGKLKEYDWLHLHHEDFTGQYGKFFAMFSSSPWYLTQMKTNEDMAKKLGFTKVSQLKLAVVKKFKEYVTSGGFLFTMCSGTTTPDIALATQFTDIAAEMYDGDPADQNANEKLDYSECLAFQNFKIQMNPYMYEYSDLDITEEELMVSQFNDYFTLFDFSAKIDPVPSMLTQCHTAVIKGFLGQESGFHEKFIKSGITLLAKNDGSDWVRYIHGNLGRGTFTLYGGHDPEDYQHAVGDPKTDLSLYKNSPGYRLILNNVLFPAAKKKKLKT
ncbi:MAG: asparagine synthetase B [Ignavibacteria bacterium]